MNSDIEKLIKLEGDYKKWDYTSPTGYTLTCEIVRNPYFGSLCGYIFITDDFELYNKTIITPPGCKNITHYHLEEDGRYCVGIDFAGLGDLIPYLKIGTIITQEFKTYKDMEHVTKECEKLASYISEYPSIKKIREDIINDILK